jgi:POT family proton-dependent oligopeptide transporter
MFERFSYYGMRALLVLFLVDAVRGGMGLNVEVAAAIYGLYTAGVYLAALPGGWIADRMLGARRAVFLGGILVAAGHFTLALPSRSTFFLGLILIVLGTGLLKPNISVLVGELYPEGGARRDAGFTIFYMGINIGAALGPFVCSWLGEKVNWHMGFGAAGIGMVLGLVQFRFGGARLGSAGLLRPDAKQLTGSQRKIFWGAIVALVAVVTLGLAGVLRLDAVTISKGATVGIVAVAVMYFGSVYLFGKLDPVERKRMHVIVLLFLGSALFWAGFEQAGSSFNLFAERFTDRMVGSFEVPAGWYQSLGPVFVIVCAPVFAALWVWLARSGKDPSIPVKFGLGLILLGGGFLVMAGATGVLPGGGKAGAWWLVATYLLHTLGEMCISPVGLSSVTKLAPQRLVGQMMGTWFLGSSLGNLIAGQLAGGIKMDTALPQPSDFLGMLWVPLFAGILLIVFSPWIKRWSEGVK